MNLRIKNMPARNPVATLALLLVCRLLCGSLNAQEPPFRPPAVPLVSVDPYLSVWSEADHLTDDATRHWTHHHHELISLIRVDGVASRLMGQEPKTFPAMPQTSLNVTPTCSIYQFEDSKVRVTMTF